MKFYILIIGLFLTSNLLSAQDLYKVTADKLNVRENPDAKSKIIGFVPQGENVEVLDSTNTNFYKIKVTNGEGWASKDFLSLVQRKTVAPKNEVKVVDTPKVETFNYTPFITFFTVCVLLVIGLIIALKYANSKAIIALGIIILIAISYFTYENFFQPKHISGQFLNLKAGAQYESFNFKSNGTVEVKDFYADTTFTTTYKVDGNILKLKDQENVILLLIQNDNTLVGEGFTEGTFKK